MIKKQSKGNFHPASENSLKTAPINERIQTRAYQIFQAAGEVTGQELDHWLQAEREIKGAEKNGP